MDSNKFVKESSVFRLVKSQRMQINRKSIFISRQVHIYLIIFLDSIKYTRFNPTQIQRFGAVNCISGENVTVFLLFSWNIHINDTNGNY